MSSTATTRPAPRLARVRVSHSRACTSANSSVPASSPAIRRAAGPVGPCSSASCLSGGRSSQPASNSCSATPKRNPRSGARAVARSTPVPGTGADLGGGGEQGCPAHARSALDVDRLACAARRAADDLMDLCELVGPLYETPGCCPARLRLDLLRFRWHGSHAPAARSADADLWTFAPGSKVRLRTILGGARGAEEAEGGALRSAPITMFCGHNAPELADFRGFQTESCKY